MNCFLLKKCAIIWNVHPRDFSDFYFLSYSFRVMFIVPKDAQWSEKDWWSKWLTPSTGGSISRSRMFFGLNRFNLKFVKRKKKSGNIFALVSEHFAYLETIIKSPAMEGVGSAFRSLGQGQTRYMMNFEYSFIKSKYL